MAESEITTSLTNKDSTELEESPRTPVPCLMSDGEVDFSDPWPGSDINFVIEDRKIYANKLILSMWSPVMETMFTSDFKEKDAIEIPLPGKKYTDFLELLKALHPLNKEITGTNVYRVLPLSSEYQTTELLRRCERYLLQQPLSIKSLVLSDKYHLPQLRSECIQYAKETSLSEIRKQPEYSMVNPLSLVEILTHKADIDEPLLKRYMPVHEHLRPGMENICVELDKEQLSKETCTGNMHKSHYNGELYSQNCLSCSRPNTTFGHSTCRNQRVRLTHCKGQSQEKCYDCRNFNFSTIKAVIKRLAPDPPIVCKNCNLQVDSS